MRVIRRKRRGAFWVVLTAALVAAAFFLAGYMAARYLSL
jgi:hypothetical protein